MTARQEALNTAFVIRKGEQVVLEGTPLHVEVVNVRSGYAGHRFEELGDRYEALLRLELGEAAETMHVDWWERLDPPGQVLVYHGYSIEILGSSTGYRYVDRWLWLKVSEADSQAQETGG